MISIVIPLYNKEKQILNTLKSVFVQTFQNFEVVIVNDGSTDNSLKELKKLNDPRIRLLHQSNAGVSAARNRGIEEAKFNLIAFLDADDEWKTEYLQTQYNLFVKYPECSVFACNYEFQNSEGKRSTTIIRKLPFGEDDGILPNYFEVASCSHPPIWTSAVMIKKVAIQTVGGFPLGIKSGEDLLTWARLACAYKIAYSRLPLAIFISTPSDGKQSKIKQRLSSDDSVLEKLNQLLYSSPSHGKGLQKYILRWHKIQSVIHLEAGNNKEAIFYALNAIKNRGSLKIFIPILILSLLPNCITLLLFNFIKK